MYAPSALASTVGGVPVGEALALASTFLAERRRHARFTRIFIAPSSALG